MARPPLRAWIWPVVAAAAILAVAVRWGGPSGRSGGSGRPYGRDSLARMIEDIINARPGAADRVRAAVLSDYSAGAPMVDSMLLHDHWRVRVTGCAILARKRDPDRLAMLLPRAGDADWRVRAAAFDALARYHPLAGPAPLRDTPLDAREEVLLAWLSGRDARAGDRLLPELCEAYADSKNVEFGRPLAKRCLRCHAGPEAPAGDTSPPPDACMNCHQRPHRQWSLSAHGNSLSHLYLTTIDPVSRQPTRMSFGEVRGITCSACHRVKAGAATRPAGPGRCAYVFAGPGASESCRQCHAGTWKQWRKWRGGRQPRRASWPPGSIDMTFRGDRRGCADCHMPRLPAGNGKAVRDHNWRA